MLRRHRIPAALVPLGAACAFLLALAPAARGQESYAYVRTVEGYADHLLAAGETYQAAINYPVVPGDRLVLAPGTRLEVVLPDGSAVRAAGEADLRFAEVAGTLDHPAGATRLELERGELQIVRPDWSGPEPLQVELGGTWVVLEAPGSYRIGADGYGTSRITVREGWAEISTPRGRRDVRAAETAWVRAGTWSVELVRAEARDELEWWGASLDRDVRLAAQDSWVDPQLAYAAAPLGGHGDWVDVSGRRAWRPRVEVGWRPYVTGYWAWTPSGMAWVASEPWGWLTHHYGLWERAPGYGWVWVPGAVYSPAWVYWYWGPTHVAWAPAGLYASYYASWDYQPSWGVYGWVSGGWDHYHDWVFCHVDDFRYGRHHGRFELGRELARRSGEQPVPRGVLATDTRPLTRGGWSDRGTGLRDRVLAARQSVERERPADLTSFVARRPEGAAHATRMFTRRPDAGTGAGARNVLGSRSAVGSDEAAPRAWSGVRGDGAADRATVRPSRPVAPSALERWPTRSVRPEAPASGTRGWVRPEAPASGGSGWVRPEAPGVGRGDTGRPGSAPRGIVRPAPPTAGGRDDRPGLRREDAAPPAASERWGVRPASPSPAPPRADSWRDRIQLQPPGGAGRVPGTGWPSGLDRNGSSAPDSDRAPLVRRVLEGIQDSARPGSSGRGGFGLRPPAAAAPQRPQGGVERAPESARPPQRNEPDRSERGRPSQTRSRGDDPPSRSGAASARSRRPPARGGDTP